MEEDAGRVQALLIKVIAHVSILPRTRSSAGAPLILIFCTAKKLMIRGKEGVCVCVCVKTVDVTLSLCDHYFTQVTKVRDEARAPPHDVFALSSVSLLPSSSAQAARSRRKTQRAGEVTVKHGHHYTELRMLDCVYGQRKDPAFQL
jgi:hypothetical protein